MLAWARDLPPRLLGWADGVQRRHAVFGFPYAVVKKYGDDAGGRHAALITYYGFLSMFPLLLLAVATLSKVLSQNAKLREDLIKALVPADLRSTLDQAVTTMPSSGVPFVVGVVGLLFAGTGVVFSASETLNHLAGVPIRSRFGFLPRYLRVLVMLVVVLAAGVAVAGLTVASEALPQVTGVRRVTAVTGTAVVIFVVLLVAARLLVARPVPVSAALPAAALGAVTIAAVLGAGTRLLTALVAKSGPVYGAFATVAGTFALLYLVSQVLLYSAEVAVVRRGRLWPRALDTSRPTEADVRALTRLATEQERLVTQRIRVHFAGSGSQG